MPASSWPKRWAARRRRIRRHDERARQAAGPRAIAFRQSERAAGSSGAADVGGDLAKLARHLIRDYPEYYHLFRRAQFRLEQHHAAEPRRGAREISRHGRIEDGPHRRGGLRHHHVGGAERSAPHSGAERPALSATRQDGCPKPRTGSAKTARRRSRAHPGIAFREFRHYQLFKPNDVVGSAVSGRATSDTVPLNARRPLA
jgi:D-alanyl-D-alanine carboxypeptidase (penicillin-binding protein 5/6)